MYEEPGAPRPRVRNPAQTRERLLQAAFDEMHKTGFRGSDLEAILSRAGVTKGAMYHHFAGKQAVGYAVVDEVILELTRAKWVEPLAQARDPMAALRGILARTSIDMADLERGCPLNNITVEMAALDEGFRSRTARIFREWQDAIAGALRWGQSHGQVRPDLDADEEAMFLIAAFEGYLALAKNSQEVATLEAGQQRLLRHLDSLKP